MVLIRLLFSKNISVPSSSEPQAPDPSSNCQGSFEHHKLRNTHKICLLCFRESPISTNPGECKEICVEAFGEKPQLVKEYFVCNSIIGKTSEEDRIMRFKIRCEFVAPLVSFST
ncbi:hydrocephalus-inducing -like protein [Brachionus plicatilis]|uniref:Hydrocephalus-inducing-like protein n=1 Tax=Brachionus plicatilis TaxID=10195 RepID=A0A3M7R0R0_BRAPC|nr:hydrocephalus-inducing -like protein [Brachionus plicatilis]